MVLSTREGSKDCLQRTKTLERSGFVTLVVRICSRQQEEKGVRHRGRKKEEAVVSL